MQRGEVISYAKFTAEEGFSIAYIINPNKFMSNPVVCKNKKSTSKFACEFNFMLT